MSIIFNLFNDTMKKHIDLFCAITALFLSGACAPTVKAPEAILPIPEPKQVEWQKMETYAFVHFGLNTFNDREWGYGDSDPKTFNPARLDCEQWVKTFVASGMKGVILTAKHHDGFCLWPTKLTEYCIRNTPYKGGKGDIVGELAAACKKYGIKFAVYLSPWDRHQANYGTPEYVDYFHKQLRELMTDYGEVFEVWFDGANGGDGWYGGAKENRTIDRKNYYNYPEIYKMLSELQPQAIIFSDGGPGCRWVGNEKGFAGATNWSFLRTGEVFPGYEKYRTLQYGHADGDQWVAAECDVSIRPGWFYHPEEDNQVKNVDQLTDLYYRSVGHNATLLLNFPVDRNGLIHPIDSANAVNFYKNIQKQLANNLLAGIIPSVSNERGGRFTAKAITDREYDTYWATEDSIKSATIEFSLPEKKKINRMMLQEYIPLGQRVKTFSVEHRKNGKWFPVKLNEETTTIGYKRLLRFETINTETKKLNSFPFKIQGISDNEILKATDGNDSTSCFIKSNTVIIDFGEERVISSFHYLPDQSEYNKGLIALYELMTSNDGQNIDKTIAKGEFSNIKHNPILQSVYFTPVNTRYLFLKAVKMINEGEPIGFSEIGIQ